MLNFCNSDSIKNAYNLKTIFLSMILLSGAIMAQGQNVNSQASQVITLRLQPISFIDFSSTETSKQAAQAATKNDMVASSYMHDIIINKDFASQTVLPPDAGAALQNEQQNNSRSMMAYSSNQPQPVYTFSSR